MNNVIKSMLELSFIFMTIVKKSNKSRYKEMYNIRYMILQVKGAYVLPIQFKI